VKRTPRLVWDWDEGTVPIALIINVGEITSGTCGDRVEAVYYVTLNSQVENEVYKNFESVVSAKRDRNRLIHDIEAYWLQRQQHI
jgi:uncharacterized protein YktA (UPF0223 family)